MTCQTSRLPAPSIVWTRCERDVNSRAVAGFQIFGGIIFFGRRHNSKKSREMTSTVRFVNPELLATLYDEHAAALELYAAQWTGSSADVVQEAFIELARQQTLPDRIVPWLYRVVRNGAISAARSASRRRKHESVAAGMNEAWFSPSQAAAIDAQIATDALRSLPQEQREVVVARIWGGLSFEQIADVADISSSSAHRRYEAALAALRERLGVQWLTKNETKT